MRELCSFCGQDCGHRPLPNDAAAVADSLMIWAIEMGVDEAPDSTFVRAAAILRGETLKSAPNNSSLETEP